MFEQDLYYATLNFPVRVRLDPLLMSLTELFGLGATAYGIMQGIVFFVSTVVLLQIAQVERRATFVAGIFVVLAVFFVVGAFPWVANVHWYPLLFALYLKASASKRVSDFCAYTAALGVWVWTAGPLSVFGLLVLIPAALFSPVPPQEGDSAESSQAVVLLTLLAAVIAALSIPVFPMEEFPGEARLAAISPLLLYETPLLGSFLSPNPIRYEVYLQALTSSAVRVGGVIAIMLILAGFSLKEERKSLKFVSTVFLFFLALLLGELFFDGASGMYAPFPTLSRIIPGLALIGLPWLLFPLFLVLVVARWASSVSRSGVLFSLALLGGAALISSVLNVYPPYIAEAVEVSEGTVSAPSRYVLTKKGAWASTPRAFEQLRRLKRGEDFVPIATASPLADEAVFAIDGNPATRWRTGRPQKPGDYFQLEFENPVDVLRIVLSVQDVPSDFPRGIKLEIESETAGSVVVIEEADWIGPVKWNNSGQPYFGPQSEVVLDLPKIERIRALKITQIGKESRFDWSIVEAKLFAPPLLQEK